MKNSFQTFRQKANIYLDYIPFIILIIYAISFTSTATSTGFVLTWRHYLGLIIVPVVAIFFNKNHHWGVLSLCATLLLGFLGVISYTVYFTTMTFGWGNPEILSITLPGLQPIFLIWLFIQFIISWRFFHGILSKKYWQTIKHRYDRSNKRLNPLDQG